MVASSLGDPDMIVAICGRFQVGIKKELIESGSELEETRKLRYINQNKFQLNFLKQ